MSMKTGGKMRRIRYREISALSIILILLMIPFSAQSSKLAAKATSPSSFTVGPQNAKATVTYYFSPDCELCAKVNHYILGEIKYYQGKVRWVFKYTAGGPNSKQAIQVLEAARKQNLYLEALALLLKKQNDWTQNETSKAGGLTVLQQLQMLALEIPGIKVKQFQKDVGDLQALKIVENDQKEGRALGVKRTPTLLVNGKIIEPFSLDTMIERIDGAL